MQTHTPGAAITAFFAEHGLVLRAKGQRGPNRKFAPCGTAAMEKAAGNVVATMPACLSTRGGCLGGTAPQALMLVVRGSNGQLYACSAYGENYFLGLWDYVPRKQ
jgi:hypothetical protein